MQSVIQPSPTPPQANVGQPCNKSFNPLHLHLRKTKVSLAINHSDLSHSTLGKLLLGQPFNQSFSPLPLLFRRTTVSLAINHSALYHSSAEARSALLGRPINQIFNHSESPDQPSNHSFGTFIFYKDLRVAQQSIIQPSNITSSCGTQQRQAINHSVFFLRSSGYLSQF